MRLLWGLNEILQIRCDTRWRSAQGWPLLLFNVHSGLGRVRAGSPTSSSSEMPQGTHLIWAERDGPWEGMGAFLWRQGPSEEYNVLICSFTQCLYTYCVPAQRRESWITYRLFQQRFHRLEETNPSVLWASVMRGEHGVLWELTEPNPAQVEGQKGSCQERLSQGEIWAESWRVGRSWVSLRRGRSGDRVPRQEEQCLAPRGLRTP